MANTNRPPMPVQELLDEAWQDAFDRLWDTPSDDQEDWPTLLAWLDEYTRTEGALSHVVEGWRNWRHTAADFVTPSNPTGEGKETMTETKLPPAAHTGGGAQDGRFDGREGVYQPTMPDDPAYMEAYDREFAPRAEARRVLNERLTAEAEAVKAARTDVLDRQRQAVADREERAERAGYRDGYYGLKLYPDFWAPHQDIYIAAHEAGKAGKDGRPENRFSDQAIAAGKADGRAGRRDPDRNDRDPNYATGWVIGDLERQQQVVDAPENIIAVPVVGGLAVDGDGAVRTIPEPPMTEAEYTQRWGELSDEMRRLYEEGDLAESGRLLTERDDLSAAYYTQVREQNRKQGYEDHLVGTVDKLRMVNDASYAEGVREATAEVVASGRRVIANGS